MSEETAPPPQQQKAAGRRLFFAIELDEEVKAAIEDLSGRLQKAAHFTPLNAVWTSPNSFHLTLYFIGPVDESMARRLAAGLPTIAAEVQPFMLDVRHLGLFPDENKQPPRVLWTGVHNPPEMLFRLRQLCGALLLRSGLPLPAQEFNPHITLARFKSMKGMFAFRELMKTYRFAKPGKCQVGRIVLMESITGGGPAHYQPFATADFPPAPVVEEKPEE
ncbi:RNA 2',3'-cyclic phosphodiesterase [soil metagenome]